MATRLVGSYGDKVNRATVRGKFPAVCFSEQNLKARLESFLADSWRYSGIGVAFEKRHLFQYGGRPVIYGDESLLERLHEDDKYLWVPYCPLPQAHREYPVDWTHEREWRARVSECDYPGWGLTPHEGVPLVLPPIDVGDGPLISLPIIVVLNYAVADTISDFIRSMPEYNGTNNFIKYLYEHVTELKIILLEDVSDNSKDEKWWRIETLPL